MNLLPIIEAKRNGAIISAEQFRELAEAAAREDFQPEQLGALLMAIFLQGLNPQEMRDLTLSMRDTGTVLIFPEDPRPLVDKHSTGGVGDKVSLILAPLLAALGLRVPMISGRGLGITGGTLDKLDSIPGLRTLLSPDEIVEQVQTLGCVICGQTEQMVPADRTLYAMRDITGTVPSIPLITSSILSKKLAENIRVLLLDVKCGAAAFMPSLNQARELAGAMTRLGRDCGLTVRALLTDMDTPLGNAAGNWLEVREIVDCLEGRAPTDLEILVVDSAAHILEMSGIASSVEDARARVLACLSTNQPKETFYAILTAQGADLSAFQDKLGRETLAPVVSELKAGEEGYVVRCDARVVGEVVHALGGGRTARTDSIQPDVGIDRLVKPGWKVESGQVIARVHASDPLSAEQALARMRSGIEIGGAPPDPRPLILEIVR